MAGMPQSAGVQALRRFNRFYTTQTGVLRQRWLDTPFSLAEGRVLYEIAHQDGPTPTDVGRALRLDAGYVSRILRSFAQRHLVRRTRSSTDGRSAHLSLTPRGRAALAQIDQHTDEDVAAMLRKLSARDQRRLVGAMQVIEGVLGAKPQGPTSYVLRPPNSGDLGWIVHRQGALYAEEWGYNEEFEALAAQIVADYVRHLRPAKERCWVAEKDGEVVGCVFLVRASNTLAKLRLLYVEPSARGLGIGGRLIDECVRFSRQAGYRRLTLWTQSELAAARRLYKKAGFILSGKKPHDSFGRKGLVAETWDLEL
jgi:DNA-binding MarR family transcriptional regulator/GNAT superfamily N-acetyltransferase